MFKIQNSEAFMLADFLFFCSRLQFSQHRSRIQLGSRLPADVPFRTVEYAVTSVVSDGLVGYIFEVSVLQTVRKGAGQSISLSIKVPQAVSFFSVLL